MKLSTTTDFLENEFGFKKALDIIAAAGYDAVDFSCFKDEFYTDAHNKNFYTELRKYAESIGLYFNQSHAPFASSFADIQQTKQRFTDIVTAMKHASYLGVRNIIVHPCQHLKYAEASNPERLFEINMDFYRRLIPYSEQYGVKIALENMWQYTNGMINHSTCSRPEEFVKYLDALDNDCFVACLDLGHAALVREDTANFIHKLGAKRLQCLHVHDVQPNVDAHTLPYFGVGEWEKTMNALADIGYQGELTFEADQFFSAKPTALWPKCAEFMAATGRELIKIHDEHVISK